VVDKGSFPGWLAGRPAGQRAQLAAAKFKGEAGSHAVLADGDDWLVVAGVADAASLGPWCLAKLAEVLTAGAYRLAGGEGIEAAPALLGWALGQYRYDRYRQTGEDEGPRLLLTRHVAAIAPALAEAEATALVRDLVNTPAEDMGPAELEAVVEALARTHKATVRITKGDTLEREFPMVHMVGRAASRSHAPRMIELEWGDPAHPRLAIVGKGVCFDSGGLDLKPSSAMLLMKKDMGGAAHAIGLARLVLETGLKVRLHLLIPAVENAVSGGSFRPGDVLRSRQGLTVEIGNTDAEGRLVLGDALTRAAEDKPGLVIDFATLTGAARVALGPDLPAMFARHDATAQALEAAGRAVDDPVWRMPLYEGYREYLKSDIADLNNSPSNGFAGAVAAALFLDRFVPEGIDWAHFDTFAWRPAAKPGRPKGGDALGLRAAWGLVKGRYG
jgi:leucyl aminopeptidase